MKIIVTDSELKDIPEVLIIDTPDKGKLIPIGQGPSKGNGRGENIPELTKELIAIDSQHTGLTQRELGQVYGVSQASVSHLSNAKRATGSHVPEDSSLRSIVEEVRTNIESIAVQKLMDTLDRFNPAGINDQMEIVTAASKMAGIVEKMSPKKDPGKIGKVELHLYGPRQGEESDYISVEVGG